MLRDQNFCAVGPDRQSAVIFDMGPPRPVLPNQQRPAAPDPNLVGTAKVEAWEAYESATAVYERARREYMAANREYDDWHAAHPTYPVKVTMPLIDAREAVDRDPERYQFHFPEPRAAAVAEASHG